MHTFTRIASAGIAATMLVWLTGVSARIEAQARSAPAAQAAPDPCASPANKIVAENCKPGNPREEWDVDGQGDPQIQGFPTDISVNVGETVRFKIKTHSPRYRIDIFRTGWYGGRGARLIQSIRPSVPLPQAQPDCRILTERKLVDCGNWAVSASWQVPADAVSGVYVARLVREDDEPESWRSEVDREPPTEKSAPLPHAYGALGLGRLRDALKEKRASHILFVVRDDAGRSDVLVQTSDPSWVAFNRYGGASLYGAWSPVGVGTGDMRDRAHMASYNRPITNREEPLQEQFFNAEYPLVRWLERNGYNVSYFAGVDSDRRGEKIKEHKVFISVGHDTYWSAAQRRNIQAARDAGVHLAFLGGTTGMWKARYLHSIDGSKTPYRTLVSYRETLANGKLDPEKQQWTGTWRDAREFNPEGAQPENALTGTIATVSGFRNDRLMVPAKYGKLRFWRNTDVAALRDDGVAVFGRGILGHEWDQDLDNGARPQGLVRLSETTVDNVAYVQDCGALYDSGTATHHMTLYRAPSGALVFSAGTAQYAWGLDDLHNYWTRGGTRLRPDPFGAVKAIQQATVNLFADMGVQPTSLQPGLMRAEPSQDRTGPVSRIEFPSAGAPVDGVVTIRGTAADRDGGAVAAVEVSVDGGRSWHPAAGTDAWEYEWRVPENVGSATLQVRAVDDSANIGPSSDPVTVRGPRGVTP